MIDVQINYNPLWCDIIRLKNREENKKDDIIVNIFLL